MQDGLDCCLWCGKGFVELGVGAVQADAIGEQPAKAAQFFRLSLN
jgi:hypothetical protein